MKKLRGIAIYLPQFHPIPENNEWWGNGFTEWSNVTKAQPLYKGHYQPHLPADLGFYDLRLHEVRAAQATLAKEYGIYGFCYYHYWFNGKRILERPFKEVFESGEPDFPFMLCWANEHWTKIWEGNSEKILLEQKYSEEDDLKHIQHLIPFFKDKRYIKIDNKPVIAIYNSVSIPHVKHTLQIWRAEAKKHGMELYICRFESFDHFGEHLVKENGFDAAVDFQPFGQIMHGYKQQVIRQMKKGLNNIKFKTYRKVMRRFSPAAYDRYWNENRRRIDYNAYVDYAMQLPFPKYKWFPGITPMWDNTARRGRKSFILKNANPDAYGKWLKSILKKFVPYSKEENLVFINAWNEWAEGNHLEPCTKWGRNYLEKTKEVLENFDTSSALS